MHERNIRLVLAFEGTAYCGWQIQKNQPTIQGLVSEAIARVTGEQIKLTGSGRTDSGTHARGLVANFFTHSQIDPAKLVLALNGILPGDIRILSARRVPAAFHARRDAFSKVYRYQIYLGSILRPHLMREYFHFPYPIDISKMERAVSRFRGERDFASFAKGPLVPNTVRRIYRCDLTRKGRRLFLTVEGNGFLHHMVRNMAGTLLEIGTGSMTLTEFRELFAKRDRTMAGFTAPAHGLILLKVKY
ncbi:MAG: tRNA pseudouridine(38-40) synthase TruA [Acidobacteria bacterium]|nr:tRNA pseudouridine(38-40) synthase TruA [Acidobacteriota bacterium]